MYMYIYVFVAASVAGAQYAEPAAAGLSHDPFLGYTPATSCAGTGAHPCHVCAGTGAHPCHILRRDWGARRALPLRIALRS